MLRFTESVRSVLFSVKVVETSKAVPKIILFPAQPCDLCFMSAGVIRDLRRSPLPYSVHADDRKPDMLQAALCLCIRNRRQGISR